jgi:hypothetical protein
MPGGKSPAMLNPNRVIGLLNELVFILLGALLITLALTGRFAPPGRSALWLGAGAVLVYWGLRIWIRSSRVRPRWPSGVRAGSLGLVGVIVLAIAWLPFGYAAPLLAIAGGVLALRGLVSAIAFALTP